MRQLKTLLRLVKIYLLFLLHTETSLFYFSKATFDNLFVTPRKLYTIRVNKSFIECLAAIISFIGRKVVVKPQCLQCKVGLCTSSNCEHYHVQVEKRSCSNQYKGSGKH